MEYATQMDAARKGIVTKEMEIVAEERKYRCREFKTAYS